MFSQLPMYQRIGAKAFKKDLGNIKKLSRALGQPHKQFESIHIAGTNGKGSTTHFISSVLVESGQKVGIYTSPHYIDFRERIKINDDFISKKEVVHFVNENWETIQTVKPSFFEITVAMAFDYFAKNNVDIAIIETGLGGRLDSTNIITPILSVITNISLDHQSMLGDTLQKIAREKAGIIKSGIPVLIGEKQKEVEAIFRKKARSKSAKLTYAKNLIKSSDFKIDKSISEVPYQKANINTAINTLQLLKKRFPKITSKTISSGINNVAKNVYYIGRWQNVSTDPLIIADSAHNEDGLNKVLRHLASLDYHKIHFVLGFVNDKTLDKILPLFPKDQAFYFAKANIPRGLNAQKLQEEGTKHDLNGRAYSSVKKALAAAKRKCKKKEMIFVGGSIFVVAEIL